jgi:hypothetical protein
MPARGTTAQYPQSLYDAKSFFGSPATNALRPTIVSNRNGSAGKTGPDTNSPVVTQSYTLTLIVIGVIGYALWHANYN